MSPLMPEVWIPARVPSYRQLRLARGMGALPQVSTHAGSQKAINLDPSRNQRDRIMWCFRTT